MALKTLILCGNRREGGHYAKRAGLTRWSYRVISNAGQIRGLPYAGLEIHILPSFAELPNRGSILAALKWKRVDYFYVDPDDLPTVEELDAEAQAAELGELDDDVLEAAYAEHDGFDHGAWAAARRRELVSTMSDEDLAKMLSTSAPEDAAAVIKEVKATKPPRKPRPTPPPAAPIDATAYFGS